MQGAKVPNCEYGPDLTQSVRVRLSRSITKVSFLTIYVFFIKIEFINTGLHALFKKVKTILFSPKVYH